MASSMKMKPSRLAASLQAEGLTALATPAARLLLVLSVVMAATSTVANLRAVDDLNSDSSVQLAMHSSTVATLIFAALAGLYGSTTDMRFGLIDHRLLSNPARPTTATAKFAVTALVGFIYSLVGAMTAVVTAAGFYRLNDQPFDVGSPLVTKALIGVVIAAPLFAVLGVAIGLVVPSQPMAIGGTLAWLLIVEPVLLIGAPTVGKWFPGAAGIALTSNPDAQLNQIEASALLASYAALAVAIAIGRFCRSDV